MSTRFSSVTSVQGVSPDTVNVNMKNPLLRSTLPGV